MPTALTVAHTDALQAARKEPVRGRRQSEDAVAIDAGAAPLPGEPVGRAPDAGAVDTCPEPAMGVEQGPAGVTRQFRAQPAILCDTVHEHTILRADQPVAGVIRQRQHSAAEALIQTQTVGVTLPECCAVFPTPAASQAVGRHGDNARIACGDGLHRCDGEHFGERFIVQLLPKGRIAIDLPQPPAGRAEDSLLLTDQVIHRVVAVPSRLPVAAVGAVMQTPGTHQPACTPVGCRRHEVVPFMPMMITLTASSGHSRAATSTRAR